MKRARVIGSEGIRFDLADALNRYCSSHNALQRSIPSGLNGARLSLHRYRFRDGFFAGQLSRFTPGRQMETIRLTAANQVSAEVVGPPGGGKEWVDSSLFFVVTGRLLAIAATRDVPTEDLQQFLGVVLTTPRNTYLPPGTLVLSDVPNSQVMAALTGVRNVSIETTIDAFATESRPQLLRDAAASDAVEPADGSDSGQSDQRTAPADIVWTGVRQPIGGMLLRMLMGGDRPLSDFSGLVGGQKLRVRLQVFAEGGSSGAEHEIANALGAVARIAPDAHSTIDLGKFGTIDGDELRINTSLNVGEPYGETAVNTVGDALATWLAETIAAHGLDPLG